MKKRIKTNAIGTEIVDSVNLGKKHEYYTGNIIASDDEDNLYLVEIDQKDVKTFSSATIKCRQFITTRAFVFLGGDHF